jgi:hypothetical protein
VAHDALARFEERGSVRSSTTKCGLLVGADHNILWFGEELAGKE